VRTGKWGAAVALLALAGCGGTGDPLDLVLAKSRLKEGTVAGRDRDWVVNQIGKSFRINDVVQRTLPAWAPSRLVYTVDIPRKGHLSFFYGVLPEGEEHAPVEFLVKIGAGRGEETVWTGILDPSGRPAHQRWVPADVDLSRYASRGATLVLETHTPQGVTQPPRAFWGNPALTALRGAPLIVVYLVDTLRADHTNPYGYWRDTTPQLGIFAKDAVVFETAVSQASWTKPSIASLMTSLLPGQHRAVQLRDALDPNLPTMAKILGGRGYATGAAIANSVIYSEGTNFDQGFDFFAGLHGPHNRPSKLVEAAAVVDMALAWLDARRGFPTFLYVHTMEPHVPYSPPAPFDRKFEPFATPDHPATDPRTDYKEPLDRDRMIARYDGKIAYGDQEFGRFIRALKEKGLYERSLIVFLGDHGEEFQDHGNWLHGRSVFDELIRIPLIVKFPGGKHSGTRVKQQVQEVDILPTLLESQGIPLPGPPILGHPLQAVLAGGSKEEPAVSEISHRGYVAHGLRTSQEKYIQRFSPEEGDLYFDLVHDPKERENLIDQKRERARILKAGLESAMTPNPFRNHLRLVGAGTYELKLRTGGWIEGVDAAGLAADEHYELEANGRKLILTLRAQKDHPREISFDTRPTGAPVFLEGSHNGVPLTTTEILMGEEGLHPDGIPARLPEVEGLSEETTGRTNNVLSPPSGNPAGISLWLTPVRGHKAVAFTKDDCERLKALGYLGAGVNCDDYGH
jgi:arylsulfatase A-like enzyme